MRHCRYGLSSSLEDEASEADMSIAYQRLKSSFEDDKRNVALGRQYCILLVLLHNTHIAIKCSYNEVNILYSEGFVANQRLKDMMSGKEKVELLNTLCISN